jgi:hypothetical protein
MANHEDIGEINCAANPFSAEAVDPFFDVRRMFREAAGSAGHGAY